MPPLLVNITANLMTGTLTKAKSNLRWPTSYTIEIKCLHQTLIPTKSVGSFHRHQGGAPLFQNHRDLYDTIDSTPLGDTPWRVSPFVLMGIDLKGQVSSWMDTDYNFWFVIHTNLFITSSQPRFQGWFWDYAPYQEHDINGSCCYHNLMSANWAWWQAVCSFKTS